MFSSDWPLPDRPDSEVYEEVLAKAAEGNAALYREVAEHDFYFFVRHVLTLGRVICKDPHHPFLFGKPWFDHPWLFDRCREIQKEPDGRLDLWPRFHFKTALITQSYPMWELAKEPGLTFAIITQRKEVAGEGMLHQLKSEMENNPLLPLHWPASFWQDPVRQAPVWKEQALTLPRQLNPKEPTFCVLSLEAGGTSYHVDRKLWDDIVTEKTVESREAIEKTTARIQQFTGISSDDTRSRWTGTRWAVNDSYQYLMAMDIARLRYHDLFGEDGRTPVLRSKEWVERWRREMGPYNFAAQMRNRPSTASVQGFRPEWWRTYDADPEDRAKGCNVYIFADTAKAKEKHNDYSAFAVVGLMRGVPLGIFNILDLYRDRMGLVQTSELMFELVEKWRPLCVFMEQVGAMRDVEHLKREMDIRHSYFRILEIHERIQKEERIKRLQPAYESGRIFAPRHIFGRCDGRKVDQIDIYRREEYQEWNPAGGSTHDDILDVLAWMVSPVLKRHLQFPVKVAKNDLVNDSYNNIRRERHSPERSAWAV